MDKKHRLLKLQSEMSELLQDMTEEELDEVLKGTMELDGEEDDPIAYIQLACDMMGWAIAVPEQEEEDVDERLPGLVIGRLDWIEEKEYADTEYVVMVNDDTPDGKVN